MTAGEERERPKAVTVIGWLWLVLAGLYLLRSLVDLVIWKALGPAAPTLLGAIEVCLALAVGLVVMIALLRSSRVRGAFERSETLPSDRPSIG
jgi:hypothetical protein